MKTITFEPFILSDMYMEAVRAKHEGNMPRLITLTQSGNKVAFSFI